MIEFVNYTLNSCSEKISEYGTFESLLDYCTKTNTISTKFLRHLFLVNIIDFLDKHCDFMFESGVKKYKEKSVQDFFQFILKDEKKFYKRAKICEGKLCEIKNIVVTGNFEEIHELIRIGKCLTHSNDNINRRWLQFLDRWYSTTLNGEFLSGLMYTSWIDEEANRMFVKMYGYASKDGEGPEMMDVTYEISNRKKFNLL